MRKFNALAATAVAVLAACSTSETPLGTEPAPTTLPAFVVVNTAGNGVAEYEKIEVCKFGSDATIGFSITDRTTGANTTGSLSLADGQCTEIGQFDGLGADVTVTETGVPSGFSLDRIDVTVVTRVNALPSFATRTEGGPSAADWVAGGLTGSGGPRGVLFEFYNSRRADGQGCTPGYWKQEQHFDSWPSPYLPSDQFSAYFEDAFPGQTLLQVLSQGGGKLIALGRHTVAALLNAASSGVNYPLSAAEVVNEFNAVYPSSNYGPQKDRFEAFNEAGCPLN